MEYEKNVTNIALLTISSQLYTLELMLGDLLVDKVSVRYSNDMLRADAKMVEALKELITPNDREKGGTDEDRGQANQE